MRPRMKILVVDDEKPIRRLLTLILSENGYEVLEAERGMQALSEAATRHPDVIILDLGLPDIEGHEVVRKLREWSEVPVLILSVREGSDEKVKALDAGADDYITKPFDASELLARLRALHRRKPDFHDASVLVLGGLVIDFEKQMVQVNKQEVRLTQTEFLLLGVLCRNAGKVVTHKQLLKEVWGPHAEDRAEYLRVYVTHVRKKLASLTDKPVIRTETGIGYRLLKE
jgi:two-component system, OmpR family, KDP operon response regulator KdpE